MLLASIMADNMAQQDLQLSDSDSDCDSNSEDEQDEDEDEDEDVYEGALLWTKKGLTKASDVLITDDPLDSELLDSVEREWKKVSVSQTTSVNSTSLK